MIYLYENREFWDERFTQTKMGIHIFALFSGSYIHKRHSEDSVQKFIETS